jgi:hypothetical protein
MTRHRYRQNPLPLGSNAPPVVMYGPEQPTPPGLQVAEQGQLGVVPLGPLFKAESALAPDNTAINGIEKLVHDPTRPIALPGATKESSTETLSVSA